ncbi:GTP pyrophosphokinase (p)ppGpp synthetase I [Desulfurella amilsii]|uniref:GTP pyrophosphokinase (P)ppGpp synthetase I n=1 Tax=Desulfurella amilsii TaxID=1562698 RepID=A0A1X4XYS6_9BACT|nr:bifunctional (p)ppGpp synthetase/guanosine-3',5'-bis(diphosphate) 3'-pyrophosphohydrolase [Desulfurella amilsii]OSS42702.1 GTP pyrophosphokinase (p)ppGpp synthetase I [Desulfurella amilsii]
MEYKIEPDIEIAYKDLKKSIRDALIKQKKSNFDFDLIDKAFTFAYEKHKTQKRASKESYIIHPVNTAKIITRLLLDENTIAAALLHDVLEDTQTKEEEIESNFGPDVLKLVKALTKIESLQYKSAEQKQADNFRKLLVSIANDLRVILIKLADRLHNMRTIVYLNEEKRKRIAKETLDIYAPMAHRLGIYWLKSELEDRSFEIIDYKTYNKIKSYLENLLEKKEEYIRFIENSLKEDLLQNNIQCEVNGRIKHIYSIYTKMQRKNVDLDSIYDFVAFRIITETEKDCYNALGVVHKIYKPLLNRFKDYIALPKQNMYQSLHTTVFGPGDVVLEIQIRTQKMHEINEEGLAAHWRYKEGKKFNLNDKMFVWLKKLLENTQNESSQEFLRDMKTDLESGEIYVFTPAGDLKVLPRGATCVDFAYEIHTKIGDMCTGAKVNNKMVPLRHELQSGDIVEILTSPSHKPSRDWLSFVKTSKARNKIKQSVREIEKQEMIVIGKNLLSKELLRHNITLAPYLKSKAFKDSLSSLGLSKEDDLFENIGLKKINPQSLINSLEPQKDTKKREIDTQVKSGFVIAIDGSSNFDIKLAKCCSPVAGDDIIGYISKNGVIMIHRIDCENIARIGYNSERLIKAQWQESKKKVKTILTVYAKDTLGLISKISSAIANLNINITDFKMKKQTDRDIFLLEIEVSNINEINECVSVLSKEPSIIKVERGLKKDFQRGEQND